MVITLDTIRQRYAGTNKSNKAPAMDLVVDRYSTAPKPELTPEPGGGVKLDIKNAPPDFLSQTSASTPKTITSDAGVGIFSKLLTGFAQGVPRSLIGYGKTIGNIANTAGLSSVPKSNSTQVKEEMAKILLGEEDIRSLEGQSEDTTKTLTKLGLSSSTANLLGPLAVAGFTAADLVTGGGKKEVVEQTAKRFLGEGGVEIISKLAGKFDNGVIDAFELSKQLRHEFPHIQPGIIDDYAHRIGGLKENGVSVKDALMKTLTEEYSKLGPPPGTTGIDELIGPQGSKEQKFAQTLKESPRTRPEVKAQLQSLYDPTTNPATLKRAQDLIESDPSEASFLAKNYSTIIKNKDADDAAVQNTISQLLIRKAQDENRIGDAVDLADILATRKRLQGQGIQVATIWNRLGPDGILTYAQKVIREFNSSSGKQLTLTDDLAKELVADTKRIATIADPEDKAVETFMMMKKITDLFPSSFAQKLSTYQTMAQLLNPKTFIRNIGGNTGFAALENISDVFAAALDTPLSLITGKRSTALPDIFTQAKGFKEGLRQGIRDSLSGIDTLGIRTQFELPKTAVFKGRVGKAAETLLNLSLRAPDRAFFQSAYDGSIYKQLKAAGLSEPTEAMKEVAFHDGLYRTFQDDTALSYAFSGLKSALNLGKEFGVGDVVLKYPRTPANLLNRGLAYSPAGFMRTVYLASKPLMGKTFDQKAFVESFGRALVGSGGLVGTGALLHRLGIITGKKEEDKDISAVQQETGLGQYRINISALKRFALSGMDVEAAKLQPGDTLVSYDWFQPAAMPISIGANLNEGLTGNGKSLITTTMESLTSGIDTLAEQPLISNLTRLLKYGDASDAVLKTSQQIPQTFIPTLLNQVRQLTDNNKRNVYDPNTINYAYNLAKNKIPGASRTIQPLVGPFGANQEIYQGKTNNLFNVFFNPAFVSKYKPSPEAKLVLDLFEQTGEVKQAPRIVSTSQKINGENIKLSPTQMVATQRFVGSVTRTAFYSLAQNQEFKKMPAEEQVKFMQSVLTDIGSAAKIIILGNRPNQMNSRVRQIIQGYSRQGQ